MSISDLKEKIKHIPEERLQNLFFFLVIVFVAFSSFAVGRMSVEQGSQTEILYPEEVLERARLSLEQEPVVVASVRGTKYYFPWCTGAQNLSSANKVEFDSIEQARDAGYLPAQNCDGLN